MRIVIRTDRRNPSTNSTVLQIDGAWINPEFKSIDWSDSSDRKWLMNHLHHCMMNDKRVTLNPTGGNSNVQSN